MKRLDFRLLVVIYVLSVSPLSAQEEQRTYVLVHGAWGSIAEWTQVEMLLEKAGHRVYLASLTGLGDRAHLKRPDIDLETHILDVTNTIEVLDLKGIYLVGHSYGGMVITGVWDRVSDRIEHVIYLDAFVPENRHSLADYLVADEEILNSNDDIVELAAENAGWVPLFGGRRELPEPYLHPLHTFIDPLVLREGSLPRGTKRTYIRAVGSAVEEASPTFAQFAELIRDDSAWNYMEIETGHGVQTEDSDGLARILLEIE